MKIIAVGHYSRVGKDTFANYLTEELNEYAPTLKVTKLNFAWKLKDIAHQLYAWAGVREPEYYDTPGGAIARDVILPALGMTANTTSSPEWEILNPGPPGRKGLPYRVNARDCHFCIAASGKVIRRARSKSNLPKRVACLSCQR